MAPLPRVAGLPYCGDRQASPLHGIRSSRFGPSNNFSNWTATSCEGVPFASTARLLTTFTKHLGGSKRMRWGRYEVTTELPCRYRAASDDQCEAAPERGGYPRKATAIARARPRQIGEYTAITSRFHELYVSADQAHPITHRASDLVRLQHPRGDDAVGSAVEVSVMVDVVVLAFRVPCAVGEVHQSEDDARNG